MKRLLWLLSITALAVLYWLCRRAYYVGFFNDDAFFIIGSRAFLHGRFAELNQPGFPPIIHYQPGYSLLLALISLFEPAGFAPYQIMSMMLMIGALVLFFILFSNELGWVRALTVVSLSALSPLFVSLSGTVLSDIPFLFISAFLLLAINRFQANITGRNLFIIAALCAVAFYTRSVGGVFTLAATFTLIRERRWKDVMQFNLTVAAFIFPYFLRNYLMRGSWLPIATEYGSRYRFAFSLLNHAQWMLSNAGYYLREIFVTNLFRWAPSPDVTVRERLTISAGGLLCAIGFFERKRRGWDVFPWVYLFFYALVLIAWDRQCARYVLPVVPFALYLFFSGVSVVERWIRSGPVLSVLLTVLLLVLYAPVLGNILNASMHLRTPLNTPAEQTYDWVRKNTDPKDIFAVEWDGQFYLYTSRLCYHIPKISQPVAFAEWAYANHIGYLLAAPTGMIVKTNSANIVYEPTPVGSLRQMASDTRFFSRMFENPAEGTTIYRIEAKKEFVSRP